jgi:FAD/FMN-containing dehydrogenase
MQLTPWNINKIAQFNNQNEQALVFDEPTLVFFSQDFGKLKKNQPAAVYIPANSLAIQNLLLYANKYALPLTIRGNGLSQNGQSLPITGGVTLSMQKFNHVLAILDDCVWVEANTSWSSILEKTLVHCKAPPVLPYNCNLSVGGVLSAGGLGASSFKYGAIIDNVVALEVIDGKGELQIVDASSELFHACLGGQGRFGVITKAALALRPVAKKVKTFSLIYDDYQAWLQDCKKLQTQVDYMELFCSSSMQGMKLTEQGRKPLVQWLYGLQLTIEFEKTAPNLLQDLKFWKQIHSQEEDIGTFLIRHDARFESMKQVGLWELIHPWYECFIPTDVLKNHLEDLLDQLPLHYASLVHIVPIVNKKTGFLQLPEAEDICAFMILNPGVGEQLKNSCLQTIQILDAFLLPRGGKRYLSGYLGEKASETYWQQHFGSQYKNWQTLKTRFDPIGVLGSVGY